MLVSLWGNRNYGNKLQSYALTKILRDLQCCVIVAKHNEPRPVKDKIDRFLRLLLPVGENRYYRYLKREIKFCLFNRQYIDDSVHIRNFKVKRRQLRNIEFGVTGSDQVWHNWFDKNEELEYYYLRFLPQEKRIAFAASFGFECIPDEDRSLHLSCIHEMKNISVREESARNIVIEAGRSDVIRVIDPTLCLSKDEWMKIAKKPRKIPEKRFILLFFLGDITFEYHKYIDRIAEDRGVGIIELNNIDSPLFPADPGEFIWLINNADYVCTDSFHATAFSVLFNKQFRVFHRVENGFATMFDRIDTLLTLTGLESREYTIENEYKYDESISDELFEKAHSILKEEGLKSINYLKDALQLSVE